MTTLLLSKGPVASAINAEFQVLEHNGAVSVDLLSVDERALENAFTAVSASAPTPDADYLSISDEWIKLLESDSLRFGPDMSVTQVDVDECAREAEDVATAYLSRASLVFVVDELSVAALLYAMTRYVVVCTEKTLTLISPDNKSAGLYRYALKMACAVLTESSEISRALAEQGITAKPVADCDLPGLAGQLQSFVKGGATLFDSLKQKKSEIVYEARYGKIYDAKYHDAVCYQLMDDYLVEIVDDAISRKGSDGYVELLDLGCGPGSMAGKLSELKYLNYRGVDISQTMIEEARKTYPELSFEVADAEAIPFPDNSFDVVFCSGMLHHFPDVDKVLVEAQRVLKPAGVLICREPNEDNFSARHSDFGFLHLQLKHIVHALNGTQSIVEPEEHEFHTDFDYSLLPDTLGQYFRVESLFTSQKVSYFYDMLMESKYENHLEKLEATLEGLPGLNIVAVAKKTEPQGVSLAVKEKVNLLGKPLKGWEAEHLKEVAKLFDEISENRECNKFSQNDLSLDRLSERFSVKSSLVVSDDSSRHQALEGAIPQADALTADNESFRAFTPFEELAKYDYVRILWDSARTSSELVSAILRCKDYGLIEIIVTDKAHFTSVNESDRSVLNWLSPLPVIDRTENSRKQRALPKRFFFSKNLYTRKNFLTSFSSIYQSSGTKEATLEEWMQLKSKQLESEYEVALMSGDFHSWLSTMPIWNSK